jgi:hypothetical protein
MSGAGDGRELTGAYRECFALWEWAAFHKVAHEEIYEFRDVAGRLERLLTRLRPYGYVEDWLNDAMRATLARVAANADAVAELSHGREALWIRSSVSGRLLGWINRVGDYTPWPRSTLKPPVTHHNS